MNDASSNRFSLAGKTVIVTGASRGIGAALADGLASAGATVTGLARSAAPEKKFSHPVRYLSRDVTAGIGDICTAIAAEAGQLDILINAAGISLAGDENFAETIQTNVVAVHAACEAARRHMRAGGSIINITSIASILGLPGNPAYNAAKGGLRMLTKSLAVDYGAVNLAGESAYIIHYLPETAPDDRLPDGISLQLQKEFPAGLLTPLVTQEVLDFYDQRRLTPIVIYPEIFDNPLSAGFFGRYLLNVPGKLANRYEQSADFEIAYSQLLAGHCVAPVADVLFIPTCDLGFWTSTAAERRGACHYAARLQAAGMAPATLPAGSTEILPGPRMSRPEIREIFRRSEAFYCYEDTALAIEAQLCGCPTVFVPNPLFTGEILTAAELGTDGYCLAGDWAAFGHAKASAGNLRPTLAAHIAAVPGRIAGLGAKWRAQSTQRDYRGPLTYPFEPRLVLFKTAPPP